MICGLLKKIKKSDYFHVELIDFEISKVETNSLATPIEERIYQILDYIALEAK